MWLVKMTYLVELRLLSCWHFDDLADFVVAGVALAGVARGDWDFHDVVIVVFFCDVSFTRGGSGYCWCVFVCCCKINKKRFNFSKQSLDHNYRHCIL